MKKGGFEGENVQSYWEVRKKKSSQDLNAGNCDDIIDDLQDVLLGEGGSGLARCDLGQARVFPVAGAFCKG